MSDLDDRLKSMRLKGTAYVNRDDMRRYFQLSDEAIADIKQVFQDAGYADLTEQGIAVNKTMQYARSKMLTGQEWYERFERELPPIIEGQIPSGAEMYLTCNDAAKRAANIEDKPSDDPGQQFTMEL